MVSLDNTYKTSHISHIRPQMERRERILDVTAVTGRYQITLTKPVRELLKVEIGDRVVFIERDGEIIIRKA